MSPQNAEQTPPQPEVIQAEMQRIIDAVAYDPYLSALATHYMEDTQLPEDLDARLLALQQLAHRHWDLRAAARAAGGDGSRQAVDYTRGGELDAAAKALTMAAASSQNLREATMPAQERPDILLVPGGANQANYDRLRYGLMYTIPGEIVMVTGGRLLSATSEERRLLVEWAQQLASEQSSRSVPSVIDASLYADVRRWAGADDDTRLTEGDLAKAALIRVSLESTGGKVSRLRQDHIVIGPDIWGGTSNPMSAVVYGYSDTSSGEDIARRAVLIETPADVRRVDGTVGKPSTYENMTAFLALYGIGSGRTVELVTTALYMHQQLPLFGVLAPAGWQVHGFGHDAVFSGAVKPGDDRQPAQYRQELVALIDAAVKMRRTQMALSFL